MPGPQQASDSSSSLFDYFRNLPKAEMHLHLEGAFRWSSIRALHPSPLPRRAPWVSDGFRDFEAFLDTFPRYIRPAVPNVEALARHTYEVLSDLRDDNVVFARIVAAPDAYEAVGLSAETAMACLSEVSERAAAELGIQSEFYLGIVAEKGLDAGMDLVRRAVDTGLAGPTKVFSGIDLQGLWTPHRDWVFAPLFSHARSAGLKLRAHAGEQGGADSVISALEVLGVSEIAHGVRVIEDSLAARAVARHGAWLHACPTSNLALGVLGDFADFPAAELSRLGCRVTLSSDDPLHFQTNLTNECVRLVAQGGFDVEIVRDLLWNGFQAAGLQPPGSSTFPIWEPEEWA